MEAVFAKMDSAIAKQDMKTFFGMFVPGYYMVDKNGKNMTHAEFRANIEGMLKSTVSVKSKTRVYNVQLMDTEVVVWMQQEMSWVQKVNGANQTGRSTTRWAESLVRRDGAWKFKSSQELFTDEPWTFKTTNN